MISKMVRITLTIALASLARTSAAWATCSNASVTGIYGFVGGGTDSNDTPTATLLQLSFDSSTGKFTGTGTTSHDGVIATGSISGTYEVASNCTVTGTSTIGGKTQPFSAVVTSTGGLKEVDGKTGTTTRSFEVLAKGLPTCTLAGLAGDFSLEATGVFVTGAPFIGPLALIGELVLSVKDGEGVISGEVAGSENGTILTFAEKPVTGFYSVSPNCTGKATITPEGKPALHYSFVVVNSGKELLAIETDEHTVVTATLQR